jgi:hypothetical protein
MIAASADECVLTVARIFQPQWGRLFIQREHTPKLTCPFSVQRSSHAATVDIAACGTIDHAEMQICLFGLRLAGGAAVLDQRILEPSADSAWNIRCCAVLAVHSSAFRSIARSAGASAQHFGTERPLSCSLGPFPNGVRAGRGRAHKMHWLQRGFDMTSNKPPIPPANRSTNHPSHEPEKDIKQDKGPAHEHHANPGEKGGTANIKQNTTNKGFFHGRRFS